MPEESIFEQEWRRCLREHYKEVTRSEDTKTETSLTALMLGKLGFGEDELRQLKVEATMRAEDMPDDYLPDLEMMADEPAPAPVDERGVQPHPAECTCPVCMETVIDESLFDADGQPLEHPPEQGEAGQIFAAAHLDEPEEDADVEEEVEDVLDDIDEDEDDKPQQLSLF